jgi:hypothetical protein
MNKFFFIFKIQFQLYFEINQKVQNPDKILLSTQLEQLSAIDLKLLKALFS